MAIFLPIHSLAPIFSLIDEGGFRHHLSTLKAFSGRQPILRRTSPVKTIYPLDESFNRDSRTRNNSTSPHLHRTGRLEISAESERVKVRINFSLIDNSIQSQNILSWGFQLTFRVDSSLIKWPDSPRRSILRPSPFTPISRHITLQSMIMLNRIITSLSTAVLYRLC